MGFTRWERVKELFDQAIERPPEERAGFLDEACDDPAVRAEVEALLEAEEHAPSFLEEGAAKAGRSLVEQGEDESGRRVGPYRLVERIGRGGMGVVYRAQRADGEFDQEVAIKFLPRHFETEARVARFRVERQIQADLGHPNIARLLGGGVTEEGAPYLVMEYVDGEPITEYCAKRQCSLEERLDLLRAASAALHHAHQNLVVHRDLKPANILVTAEGQVKLLDFGIAKLLDEEDAPHAPPATRTGIRPMTPAYAAPEQVAGEAVTTATDIYQLGVLAYELLTGARPFDLEGKSPSEMEQVVVREMPTRPSTALEQMEGADRSNRTWARRLRGDLDTIILKALRKEPGRRYGSAELFAEDLQRYQADRPVRARPATIRYRATKFARRNRTALVGALVAVLLLVGIGAFHVNQVAAERDKAERQAATAEEAVDFMADLFESNDPHQENGETVTARELLRRGEDRVSQLSDRPAIQAELLDAMGDAYRGLGSYGTADSLFRAALERWRDVLGEQHPATAATLNKLGCTLRYQGQYAAADSITRKALSIRRDEFGEQHPATAETLNNLGIVLQNQGQYAAADSVYRKALSIRRQELGERHPSTATTLNNLGIVLRNQGQYAAADSVYREALSIRREELGARHPATATTLNNMGVVLRNQGQYAAADSVYREALSIEQETLGERHPSTATTLSNLGIVLRNQGQYAAADSVYREALSIEQEKLRERHPTTAITLNNLGRVLRNQDRYAAADSVYREALSIRREELGERHPKTANSIGHLADLRMQRDQLESADSLYRKEITISEEVLGADDWRVARAQKKLGTCLMKQGRYAEAEEYLANGFDVLEAERGADDSLTQEAAEALVEVYEALGEPEKTVAYEARLEEEGEATRE